MSTPLFKEVSYSLSKLMDDIEMGEIGLPDLQRPFVWPNAKVRDLFDSMFRGYPVGYFLFWENKIDKSVRNIGTNLHQKFPSLLIVDGQQRLTSLYAVTKGVAVIKDNYDSENIEIAFRPLDGKFEVADAGIRRSAEYIHNISSLFAAESSYGPIGDYIKNLKDYREKNDIPLTDDEIRNCERNLEKLFGIKSFPFTALQLSSNIDEEQVAEVFVRINSKGKSLNQSDFILTLMSVFWEDGRKELEEFCRSARKQEKGVASPFNYFIEPDPEQLLRVAIGSGFRRARLKYAYSLLRGKDLETGKFSSEQREKQFDILRTHQIRTLNIQNWHDFLLIIQQSGFRGKKMISSKLSLMYAYVLYLIGKEDLNVDNKKLKNCIGKFFFMSNVTQRYTGGSPETMMERDLADLRSINNGEEFVTWIENAVESELTDDFWKTTLPSRLETSSANSPFLHCYNASLNILEAKALFSNIKIWDALDPSTVAYKNKVERHHLFPKKFLNTMGIKNVRDTNQIANYALIEWRDNISISDEAPEEYFSKYTETMNEEEIQKMCYLHALPNNWFDMSYFDFLQTRRQKIADIIKDGFKKLDQGNIIVEKPNSLIDMINNGEGLYTEFKSTLRVNLHTMQRDAKMEHAVLKTINGFLNSTDGGNLVIGISDDGSPIGLETDEFLNEDKMDLHLGNLIKDRLGADTMLHIKPRFEDYKDKRVYIVECLPSQKPIYMKNGNEEEFYIRASGSSSKLSTSQIVDYIRQRFHNN